MGAHKYLFYNAFRKELIVNKVSKKYTSLKNTVPVECEAKKEKGNKTKKDKEGTSREHENTNKLENEEEDFILDDANKSNYVLTLTQVATLNKKNKNINEESIFEPISQVCF